MKRTCLEPTEMPEAVGGKIREGGRLYGIIFVVYGDCGTAGALDGFPEEEDFESIPGPRCFSSHWGKEGFAQHGVDETGTFYLPDFLCQFLESFFWGMTYNATKTVLAADEHPDPDTTSRKCQSETKNCKKLSY